MANKKQNKVEYVKPHSISLKPSEYLEYKEQSKKWNMSFSEMVRIFFQEDKERLNNAQSLNQQTKLDLLKAKRLVMLNDIKK